MHVYHLQKYPIFQFSYLRFWGIAYFFCHFKAQGVLLDPLNTHLSGTAHECTKSNQFMELGCFKQ